MQGSRARARFRRNRAAMAGAAIVLALVAFAVVGPLVVGHDPYASDFEHGLASDQSLIGPSAHHLLGVDRLFRDELARLAYGARLSLLIGVAATLIASVIGGLVGIVAGYYEGSEGWNVPWSVTLASVGAVLLLIAGRPGAALGLVLGGAAIGIVAARRTGAARLRSGARLNADVALMRLVDVGLSFPFLLLVMAIGAALDQTTVASILVTLGLTGWLGTARVLRAKTMQIRNLEYVVAARALGERTPAILARHVLPNVAGPLIVIATVSVAQMIIAESVLSYLGVGIAPPTASFSSARPQASPRRLTGVMSTTSTTLTSRTA